MHWWLYLYLSGLGIIEVPGHFETLADCRAHGEREVAEFKERLPQWSAGYAWCIRGGKADLGCD